MENWYQRICGFFTDHKYRVQVAHADTDPREYYHECRLCKYFFWNYEEAKTKSYIEEE